MSESELTAKIRELKLLQNQQAVLDAEIESIKDDLKKFMGEIEEIHCGEYRVTWKTIISERFSVSEFKTANEKLYTKFLRESVTRRFVVS